MGDRLATVYIGQKVGAAVPLSLGELGSHLTQCRLGRGLYTLVSKWYLEPSNSLATIRQRYRQTDRHGQEWGQRSHSTGRTVLQTVVLNATTMVPL